MMVLRILHPMDPLGRKVGGAESFVKNMIRFSPSGLSIELVGTSSREVRLREWREELLAGREYRFLPLLKEEGENRRSFPPLSLRYTVALRRSGLSWQNRILFFNRIEPAILPLNGATPRVAVVHNDVKRQIMNGPGEVLWSRCPGLYRRVEKRIFRSLQRVFCVHRETWEEYRELYPLWEEKFLYLPPGFDGKTFSLSPSGKEEVRRALAEKEGLDPHRPWILFVGRLQPQKNPLALLDALKALNPALSKTLLLIVGEGDMAGALKARVKREGMEERVLFLGYRQASEIASFYRAADLLLLSSRFEGLPLTALEALSCGLPVVAPPVGDLASLIHGGINGEVVSGTHPEDAARALEKVLTNPALYSRERCSQSVDNYRSERLYGRLFDLVLETAEAAGEPGRVGKG